MEAIEAMETCRAIRHLKSDPVPDPLVERVVYAATRAPSPGNSQGWDFVVVRDPATKSRIRDLIAEPMSRVRSALAPPTDSEQRRMQAGADHLIGSLDQVPVLIFVCGAPCYPPQAPMEQFVWSALYPATQNLLVAARSLGLGGTLTTFHLLAQAEIRKLLGIPDEVRIAAMVPLGWPERAFGPVRRKPVSEVLHWERW